MTLNNTDLIRVVAVIGASGLVLASAGFGAFYAYTVGIQHGIILAGLSILMALALEAIKPLAISAGISLMGERRLPAALLLSLGGISVAYSLTAELSLVSMSKGDLVAERQSVADAAKDARAERKRIELELTAIGVVRPSAAIKAELDGLLLTPGADGCAVINGKVTREVCPKVSDLRAEKARAERRESLERQLGGVQTIAPKVADPGSTALTAYLTAMGFNPDVEKVGLWLLLVPVLALEIGSALAKVLVDTFPRTVKAVTAPALAQGVDQPAIPDVGPARERVKTASASRKQRARSAIVDHLKANGGRAKGGERGLAKLIGSSRGTMKRALNGLVLAGVVSLEASRSGTILRLIA